MRTYPYPQEPGTHQNFNGYLQKRPKTINIKKFSKQKYERIVLSL
jgi:hypothetical protein